MTCWRARAWVSWRLADSLAMARWIRMDKAPLTLHSDLTLHSHLSCTIQQAVGHDPTSLLVTQFLWPFIVSQPEACLSLGLIPLESCSDWLCSQAGST